VPNYLPESGEYFVSAAPVLLRVSPRAALPSNWSSYQRPRYQTEQPPQAPPVDLMNPPIRAEVARHIALGLQQERQRNASHRKARLSLDGVCDVSAGSS
jgi:hypothetical protein